MIVKNLTVIEIDLIEEQYLDFDLYLQVVMDQSVLVNLGLEDRKRF